MAQLLLDFLSAETKARPNIIGRGILPVGGKAILGGAAKSNKSFVVLNAALCLAKGVNLFDAKYKNGTPVFPVAKQNTVLLMEQEIGADGLRKRIGGILGGELERAICPFFIHSKDTSIRFDTPEGVMAIEKEIDETRPDVVIFDPLSKFHLLDENSAQDMGRVMRVGDYFIQKYGCAILYVHHTGLAVYDKENQRRGGNRLRGSSAVFADVDTFIEVSRMGAAHTAEPLLTLSFELRQGEPIPPQHIQRMRNGTVVYKGEHTDTLLPAGAAG